MDKLNELIFHIEAILGYCKDIHYNNIGYESHLLADRVAEGIDIQDDIKEQMIIAEQELPLPSYAYLKGALPLIPDITGDNQGNWLNLLELINKTRKLVEKIKANRGGNALLDNLAQALNTSAALIFIQTREQGQGEIEESIKAEENNGKETPIDRKEYKKQVTADKDVANTIVAQSNEQAALCEEESALDRVSKKLGIK